MILLTYLISREVCAVAENRVLIAMSGGVDSSVAALLAQQAGYCCAGATFKF